MNKAVILGHGWNVSNPMSTVGKLKKPFEKLGYHVEVLNYGYWPHTWQATKFNYSVARRLAKMVNVLQAKGFEVDYVGHSNGVAIGYIANDKFGMCVNTFVAINPALKKNLNPSNNAQLVQVWHNDGDRAVVLGKWLRWLTGWARKARPWGEMGNEGYTGKDKNVVNFNCSEDFKVKAHGHSAVFQKPASKFFLREIAAYCSIKVKRVVE